MYKVDGIIFKDDKTGNTITISCSSNPSVTYSNEPEPNDIAICGLHAGLILSAGASAIEKLNKNNL